MYIEGLSSFNARTMVGGCATLTEPVDLQDFQLDIYFQQEWLDRRLIHTQGSRMLLRDKKTFALLWHPDVGPVCPM